MPTKSKSKSIPKPASKSPSSTPLIHLPPRPLTKSYEPAEFEGEIYRYWESNECFKAQDKNAEGQKAFSMVIPPPNVTGVLHMGHALTNTIQDILIRWRRMHGDNTLWLPGTDHAGIATQAQVEKAIAKESVTQEVRQEGRQEGSGGAGKKPRPLTRHDLGREKFLERTWQWKAQHGSQITSQLKRLGSSLDWSRERFTMDDGLSEAVREVFVRLYEEDLIYRGERIINWCPRCQTALSDLEVIPTDRKGHFWHIHYAVVDHQGKPVLNPLTGEPEKLTIATTRPETLLGDTAVAVHPDDPRYQHLHGKKVLLPLVGRMIPVIKDPYVDMSFGSGALKITPAHDFNDYELGKKHGLSVISVMGKDGRITEEGGQYKGLKYAQAREKILEDLKTAGLLAKVEDHANKVGLCQRCETTSEPIISQQWFVKIEPLAVPAIQAVESGKIEFVPKTWEKTYFEWMHNIRDWCISRQLWWGHQIPAWYCNQCDKITVAKVTPKLCSQCSAPGATSLKQDEDVLDTWFSSALWPFSTLGWPQKTEALSTFYPTSILETGFDIIFFWVARMIMMGIHFMGEVPFHKVYLHAMVRDEKGEKMSKSKGNVVDPLVIINQHGADPLRFTLAIMAGQGRDIKLSLDRVEGYRAFCNKLWNAVKFFHLQLEPTQGPVKAPPARWILENSKTLSVPNQWILSRLQSTIQIVEEGLQKFELNVAAQALYDFTWREFCDWYIELAKEPLKPENQHKNQKEPSKKEPSPKDPVTGEVSPRLETLYTMHFVLDRLLRLLHPFMPFVTEELARTMPWNKSAQTKARKDEGKPRIQTLMFRPYPKVNPSLVNQAAEQTIVSLKEIVEAIRNVRGENNISPKVEFELQYLAGSKEAEKFISQNRAKIQSLAKISEFKKIPMGNKLPDTPQKAQAIILITQPPLELRINLEGLVNVEEEIKRLMKEVEKVGSDLSFVQNKLSQETFVTKAPAALVAKERLREKEMTSKLADLKLALARLKS